MVKTKHMWIVSLVFTALVLASMGLYSISITGMSAKGKPADVQAWSNGFPSGAHFNLNIHGKKDSFVCDPTSGGGSIFVREYGYAEIQYIMNKKSPLTELNVIDPCAMSKKDPAKIQLPKGTYQVYARVLGKPGKIKTSEERKVVFYPKLIDACNDNVTPIKGFGDFIDCSDESLLGLGLVTTKGAFVKEEQELIRIAPVKGKNKAQPITDMFYWSGYVCEEVYDTNGDGEITMDDFGNADLTGDGLVNEEDLEFYLEFNCQWFEEAWIFDIADLVIYGWDYYNHGTKLVQVRFYPEDSTEFI